MKPIIYQAFTRLWGNRNATRRPGGSIDDNGAGKMNDFTDAALRQLSYKGITHVWYTGVIRHATTTDYSHQKIKACHPSIVKGRAGSPYAITDYYDIDPDIAVRPGRRMQEFKSLVARTHKAGLKVIIDFVPNHVARQYHSTHLPKGAKDLGEGDRTTLGFDPQNNFYYCPGCAFSPTFDLAPDEKGETYSEMPAKATGNDRFTPSPGRDDWYETVKLNYGVDYYAGGTGHFSPTPDTWTKMLDILLFWAKTGVDGFRCDMAEMVPTDFWSWATGRVKAQFPSLIFIGEVYNRGTYHHFIGSGFDYLYDKVGMYDTLRAVTCGLAPARNITGAWMATDDISSHMLYFLENHDEQRLASDFFARDGRKGIPALVVSALLKDNAFMLYAGGEYGEKGMDAEGFSGKDGRTTIFDYWSIDTLCRAAAGELTRDELQLEETYRQVMTIARDCQAVVRGKSFDLMYVNPPSAHFCPDRHYAFLRSSSYELLLVAVNFSDSDAAMEIRIPKAAFDYMELPAMECPATDMLTGDCFYVALEPDGFVAADVPAHGARILKIKR